MPCWHSRTTLAIFCLSLYLALGFNHSPQRFRTFSRKSTLLNKRLPTLLVSTTNEQEKTKSSSSPISSFASLTRMLTSSASYLAQNPIRLRYAVAQASRVAYFLAQGVGLTYLIPPQSEDSGNDDKKKTRAQPLQPDIIISAIVDALMDTRGEDKFSSSASTQSFIPTSSNNNRTSSSSNKPMVSERTAEEQVTFFSQNFKGIIDVLRRDMKNVESGIYKLPYDLDPVQAPQQWSPLSVARMFADYVTDRRDVQRRRDTRDGFEIRRSFSSPKYPQYYLQNFHYQSDGWLSAKSARLYDYQVESLFLGTADAMRRQILPSFANFVRYLNRDSNDIAVLDIATGTGKFASFLMDNHRTLNLTVMDLSPFYVAEAKNVLKNYETVKFVEAPAEQMPFPDASFDALTCVYLFHELPRPVREKVVSEMHRVLKPNGKLFFVDSAQRGDVPNDEVLEGFTVVAHEPYYLDYVKSDLHTMFTERGFEVEETATAWVSKCITLKKIDKSTSTPTSTSLHVQETVTSQVSPVDEVKDPVSPP